ncbi:MAG: hypothetical protein ACHQF2_08395, partial [Flavobacteriales bacterium]
MKCTLLCWVMPLFIAGMYSCNGDKDNGQVLATVNGETLYLKDIKNIFPTARLKYEDSMTILKAHVKRWITE